MAEFLGWLATGESIAAYRSTFVALVEETRDRIQGQYQLSEEELFGHYRRCLSPRRGRPRHHRQAHHHTRCGATARSTGCGRSGGSLSRHGLLVAPSPAHPACAAAVRTDSDSHCRAVASFSLIAAAPHHRGLSLPAMSPAATRVAERSSITALRSSQPSVGGSVGSRLTRVACIVIATFAFVLTKPGCGARVKLDREEQQRGTPHPLDTRRRTRKPQRD